MTTKKNLNDAVRAKYLSLVSDFLTAQGEEVLVTGTNEIALPCVDSEGNDTFIVLRSGESTKWQIGLSRKLSPVKKAVYMARPHPRPNY